MEIKEVLEKILSIDFTQLTPSTIMKSELYLLTNDEFAQLYEHIRGSKYRMEEEGWNTIIIGNMIFITGFKK